MPARDPTKLHIAGVRAADAHALGAWLAEPASEHALLAADLSLSAWRNHHVTADLFAQLGLPEPAEVLAEGGGSRPVSVVESRIDQETAGDRAALAAFQLAAAAWPALARRGPLTVAVLIDPSGTQWEPADAFFVRFLAQILHDTGHRLVLAYAGCFRPELPADWVPDWTDLDRPPGRSAAVPPLCTLVPGVITPAVTDALALSEDDRARLILLGNGCHLVPPQSRPDPDSAPAAHYDRLGSAARDVWWLAAYAACRGTAGQAPPSLLRDAAQRLFESGSRVAVLRVLDRAISGAGSAMETAVLQLLGQSVRLAAGQFAEVGAAPDPGDHLPAELQGWLWHTKGWALTIAGQAAEAARCLERARELLGRNPDRDEYLFVLNISALNQLKLGDWDGALATERQIQTARSRIHSGYQLAYINSLNMARLYVRSGDYDTAERYYHEAFATSRGAWSDSDAIYYAVCLAKLNVVRRRHREALEAWTRAALVWMSSPVPEALEKRVAAAILDPGAGSRSPVGVVLDDVSAALAGHLITGAAQAGVDLDGLPAATAAFVRPEMLRDLRGAWHVLRGAGCWCLGQPAITGPVWASPAGRRLGSVLLALLVPAPATDPSWTIVVDDRQGCGLPVTEADLLLSCLRLGVDVVQIDGREIALPDADTDAVRHQLRVRIGAAVSAVERGTSGDVCRYKRYRPPRPLSGPASGFVRQLGSGDRLVPDGVPMDLLRELERDRIVEIRLLHDLSFERLAHLVKRGMP